MSFYEQQPLSLAESIAKIAVMICVSALAICVSVIVVCLTGKFLFL